MEMREPSFGVTVKAVTTVVTAIALAVWVGAMVAGIHDLAVGAILVAVLAGFPLIGMFGDPRQDRW